MFFFILQKHDCNYQYYLDKYQQVATLVGGKSHITKGLERVRNLENIIAKQNLGSADLRIATDLLNDLKSALELGGY